jgi:N-acetylglucosaminyldiphosphoundecaprenol N-acetyl-beta-D-mannosaminyltransferase
MFFCNINFNLRNKTELFERIHSDETKIIFTLNAAVIVEANRTKRLFNMLNRNYVSFDGQVPFIAAKLLNKNFWFEKLSGSDIIYDFCEFAKEKRYRVFFLGSREDSNAFAVTNIKKMYSINIAGYSPEFEDYPFSDRFNNNCLNRLDRFKPDILFVGFGTPKADFWVEDNLEILKQLEIKYVICCGGAFDFVSNHIKRAPWIIQKIGLEGLYRFFQEPNKMRIIRLINSFGFFRYIWHKPDFAHD